MSFHRLWVSAAVAGCVACTAPVVASREPGRAVPGVGAVAVDGVDVEQVADLGPGVPLNFTVFGTPRSRVALRIDGARRLLDLREGEPGIYEGSYVIDAGDAIRPESRVTASLQRQGTTAYATLDEPLLLARGSVPWNADAAIAAPTAMPIPITVTPPPPVPPAPYAATTPGRDRERDPCSDCAVVEAIRTVDAPPRGGVIGTIGGAIAGAVLGKELGAAHTRRVLTVLGAIGGAFAGREIERQATRSTQYDVDLRLADGTLLKRRYEQAPPFVAGATIRLGAPPGRGTPVPASL
ncbi:MAG: glycine zipper 2TM domain-containing protein [Caldimonas sp.]